MARSTCIYVVMIKGILSGAFTVKRELESWLPENGDGVKVFRMKDGIYQQPKIDITNEFYEN